MCWSRVYWNPGFTGYTGFYRFCRFPWQSGFCRFCQYCSRALWVYRTGWFFRESGNTGEYWGNRKCRSSKQYCGFYWTYRKYRVYRSNRRFRT